MTSSDVSILENSNTMNAESPSGYSPASFDLDSLHVYHDALGQLCADDGKQQRFENISTVRLFPLSHPNEWIALLDSTGREIVCIPALEALSPENQKILAEELSIREFVPIVQRVTWVSGNSEPCEWRVETDRGPTRFILKDEDDVRRLGESSVLIVDSFGIRYLIPDRNQLDRYSQRIIEWYV